MAFIMHYNLGNVKICADKDVMLNHNFALSFDSVPEKECRLFMLGRNVQDFNSMPTYDEIIQSPIADLVYDRKFQYLDDFIARVMKEKGYVSSSALGSIEDHMTTIMKLRTLNNHTTNPILIEAYENILKEIKNNIGIEFKAPNDLR